MLKFCTYGEDKKQTGMVEITVCANLASVTLYGKDDFDPIFAVSTEDKGSLAEFLEEAAHQLRQGEPEYPPVPRLEEQMTLEDFGA